MSFTFQYGQIYYAIALPMTVINSLIYIPIWLDLLYMKLDQNGNYIPAFTFQYGQIYYRLFKESIRN